MVRIALYKANRKALYTDARVLGYIWYLCQIAGTTAAGLRAGKPTVIVPFIADQPFWGKVVHELGVGLRPIPQKKLTSAVLVNAIQSAISDTNIYHNAGILGEKIRAEDGTGNAVRIVSEQISAFNLSSSKIGILQ